MNNFEFGFPTSIFFGKDQVINLADAIAECGKNVLVVYGGGSVKRNGIYDDVVAVLKKIDGVAISELGGISANPRVSYAREGIAICKEKSIDAIVAVGGGSVLDCSKLIAAGAYYSGDCWDLVKNPILIEDALPVFIVSTVAASGSDVDCAGVILNEELNEKEVFGAPVCSPRITILDPQYTTTVPIRQTAAGVADMMMHILEDYLYRSGDYSLSNAMMEAVLKIMVENGTKVMKTPDDYDVRANLMWAASLATSGMLNFGRGEGSATIHWIEGVICGYYHTVHGEVLAILMPVWMEHILNDVNAFAFADLATNVFGLPASEDVVITAKKGIEALRSFFADTLKIPSRLSDVGVDDKHIDEIARKAITYPLTGGNVTLNYDDVCAIISKAL